MFFLLLVIIITIINTFRRFFSECTEANATALIPLDNILSGKFALIIGFSSTYWIKMRFLAGSLSDSVHADTIISKVRGRSKMYGH